MEFYERKHKINDQVVLIILNQAHSTQENNNKSSNTVPFGIFYTLIG